MTDPDLDLSIASLARACRGNVAMLPRFMVHDNGTWPPGVVRTDNKGRVHMRRSTFLSAVVGQVPVREGLWLGPGVQEFFIDLQPHHLQGSIDNDGGNQQQAARGIVRMDSRGRVAGDEGYGDDTPGDHRQADAGRDAAQLAASGQARGIGSSVFGGGGGDDS